MSILLIALATFALFLSAQVGVPALPFLAAGLGADPGQGAAVLSAALAFPVALAIRETLPQKP